MFIKTVFSLSLLKMSNSSPKFEFCFDETKRVHIIKISFPWPNFGTSGPSDQ